VRRLTREQPDGKVLSVYLNLDPSEFATAPARRTQVNSALNEALAAVEELEPPTRSALGANLEDIRAFLEEEGDWATGAHGVAVFSRADGEVFDVVKLPEAVDTAVFLDDAPHVRPLVEMLEAAAGERWCVALVNRRGARIFLGGPSRLRESEEMDDPVHGAHQQGGWSQARYQRAIEEGVDDHLDHACERLLGLHTAGRFDRLVVGATEELWPRIAQKLQPAIDVEDVDRIDVDTQSNVGVGELQDALRPLAEARAARREEDAIERLQAELGSGGRGAAGIGPVLDALNQARLGTLLVESGFDRPGAWCPRCGWLGVSAPPACPVDQNPVEETGSIVEKAIERTAELSGDCLVVQGEGLSEIGGIAALLRF
jgi:peptide subunit release factor 1 (eRF1)